jgi:glycosyltransferase involved in cell wall biosynthesis
MRTLPSVLDAYLKLQSPKGGWKLIVVDNASTDKSREIINSFHNRLPLTSLYEEKPGKNSALNSALTHVEGDLVVLTDDDAFPRQDWLVAMRTAADVQRGYSLFGGVVVPRWESTPPEWVLNWVPPEPVFTLTPLSLREGPIDHHFVVGPCMAVRTDVFNKGFRFDQTIGPKGANYAMGSETEFVKRLGRHGYGAWHVRNAQVEHFIRNFQMNRSWILRRAIRLGRGLYRLGQMEQQTGLPAWRGVPRYLFKEVVLQTALLSKGLLTLSGETIFRARWELNVLRGQIMEAHRSRI